ncbi:hypothetical protein [Umezawaea sp.]|uniref:hypothetical protein n=1 Tax=Umezawaea sp. TaxID=1955258 RepID=UPI002ED0D7AB
MRRLGELAVPGAVVGMTAGFVAGGLALVVGQPPGWAMVTALTLGVPLALLGGVYGLLVGSGRIRIGVFAPAALFWFAGFPLARLAHEVLSGLVLGGAPAWPPDLPGFLAYQAMVSVGWAIGFLWLHERIAPGWLRRVRAGNPAADRLFQRYVEHAASLAEARERRRSRAGRA